MAPIILIPSQREAFGLPMDIVQNLHLCGTGLVGCVNGALPLVLQKPEAVLLVGIAGTYDEVRFPLGNLARVDQMYLADFGAQMADGSFRTAHQLDFGIPQYWASDIVKAPPTWQKALSTLAPANSASVNRATGTQSLAQERQQFASCEIEEMEGAALANLCHTLGIPFFHVRAISNLAGPRNVSQWKTSEALQNLGEWLATIMDIRHE